MRNRIVHLSVLALLLVPSFALAAAPRNFCELVNFFVGIFNALTGLFVLAAVATYLFGITMNIRAGEASHTNLRNIILWGLLGIFLMVSVWGILRLLQETLFDAAPGAATTSARSCT